MANTDLIISINDAKNYYRNAQNKEAIYLKNINPAKNGIQDKLERELALQLMQWQVTI